MNAADAVSCDVDGAFHRPGRETEGEGGTKSEGKSFLGSTMESKESEQKRREREREEHLRSGQGDSDWFSSRNANPATNTTFTD